MTEPSAEQVVEEASEHGVRWQLLRRDGELLALRDGVRQFGDVVRHDPRAYAEFVTAQITGRDDLTVTLAGLGTGQLARALLDVPGVCELQVIEESSVVVSWARTHFAVANHGALSDPRLTVRVGKLAALLDAPDAPTGRFALVLDLDPSLGVENERSSLYRGEGLARCMDVLRPGGVLALASTRREPALLRELSARMQNVGEVAVPVDTEPGALDYFYRARRPATGGAPRGRN